MMLGHSSAERAEARSSQGPERGNRGLPVFLFRRRPDFFHAEILRAFFTPFRFRAFSADDRSLCRRASSASAETRTTLPAGGSTGGPSGGVSSWSLPSRPA